MKCRNCEKEMELGKGYGDFDHIICRGCAEKTPYRRIFQKQMEKEDRQTVNKIEEVK